MKCKYCGALLTEEHGKEPGDYNWILCRGCGRSWPTDAQAEKDKAKERKPDER